MKVLVEHCLTRKVLGEDGLWHRQETKAKTFGTSVEALDFCLKKHLVDTEIVLHFENDPRFDIKVPVGRQIS